MYRTFHSIVSFFAGKSETIIRFDNEDFMKTLREFRIYVKKMLLLIVDLLLEGYGKWIICH